MASNPPLESHLEILNAPLIAEWRFDEGTPPVFYGSKLDKAGTRVVANIRLNPSRLTAIFDIVVPVELKAFAHTTYLHLLIDPANIRGIVESSFIPDAVRSPFVDNNPSGHVIGLEFDMMKPISLLGPATARVPKNKKARGALDRLKSLAQVARFTLYVPTQYLSHGQAQQLSTKLSAGHKYHADWPEFKRMYGGKGAVLLQWDTIETTATAPDDASPPAYDQIGPAPPLPLNSESSLKKPSRDSSLEADRSTKRVKFEPVNAPGDTDEDAEEQLWKDKLQEEVRALRREVKALREEARSSSSALQHTQGKPLTEPTTTLTSTTAESLPADEAHSTTPPNTLESRIDMLEDRINIMSDQLSRLMRNTESAQASTTQQIADLKKHVQERMEEVEDSISKMLDLEVQDARRDAELGLDEAEDRWEERLAGTKAELERFVAEEMAEVEESIKQSLRAAPVYFDIE